MFLGPVGDDPQGIEVKRLGIRPGDRLVVKVGQNLNDEEFAFLEASFARAFEKDDYKPPVLVLEGGMEIGVIGPEAPEAAGVVKQAALSVLLESGFDPFNARAVLGLGPEADGA